jgi:hypothetical protein
MLREVRCKDQGWHESFLVIYVYYRLLSIVKTKIGWSFLSFLADIKAGKEANLFWAEYRPEFNRRCAVDPKEKGNLHWAIPRGLKWDEVLGIKVKRALRNDLPLPTNRRFYQVEDSMGAASVMVYEGLDGSIRLEHKEQLLKIRKIPTRPPAERREPLRPTPKKEVYASPGPS